MADTEKLDLILSEIQDMKNDIQGMKNDIQGMKNDIQGIKNDIQGIKNDIQGIKTKVDKLALGQTEIQKEMYMMNRKISDTYNVALDALGTSAENRTWLENGKISLVSKLSNT